MKYFKDIENKVYAFETDGSQDAFISSNLTSITESEADILRQPVAISLVPAEVSIFQAEESLAHFGYLPAVQAIVDNPQTPEKYRRAWRRVTSVRRDSEVMAGFASLIPLTVEQVDELFIYAKGVTA